MSTSRSFHSFLNSIERFSRIVAVPSTNSATSVVGAAAHQTTNPHVTTIIINSNNNNNNCHAVDDSNNRSIFLSDSDTNILSTPLLQEAATIVNKGDDGNDDEKEWDRYTIMSTTTESMDWDEDLFGRWNEREETELNPSNDSSLSPSLSLSSFNSSMELSSLSSVERNNEHLSLLTQVFVDASLETARAIYKDESFRKKLFHLFDPIAKKYEGEIREILKRDLSHNNCQHALTHSKQVNEDMNCTLSSDPHSSSLFSKFKSTVKAFISKMRQVVCSWLWTSSKQLPNNHKQMYTMKEAILTAGILLMLGWLFFTMVLPHLGNYSGFQFAFEKMLGKSLISVETTKHIIDFCRM
jgi:hypothetical protein